MPVFWVVWAVDVWISGWVCGLVYWHFTFGVVCCLLVEFSGMVIVVGLGCVL